MIPSVCSVCGNIKITEEKNGDCPYCALSRRTLSIKPSDESYVVFLSLIERLKDFLGLEEVYQFVPSSREFEWLQGGDQIVDLPAIWRIIGKTSGPKGINPKMWISVRAAGRVSQNNDEVFIDPLPPFVSEELLNLIPLNDIRRLRFLPIAESGAGELVLAGFGDHDARLQLGTLLPDRELTFWRTSQSAFQSAFRCYFADYHPRGCGPTYHYLCPRHWYHLTVTDAPDVRFCDVCDKLVYLQTEAEDPKFHVKQRHCIAKYTDQGVTRAKFSIAPGEVVPEGLDDPYELD